MQFKFKLFKNFENIGTFVGLCSAITGISNFEKLL